MAHAHTPQPHIKVIPEFIFGLFQGVAIFLRSRVFISLSLYCSLMSHRAQPVNIKEDEID